MVCLKPRHGPDGREGIGGFACGACVEIMAPDFANYQEDLECTLPKTNSLHLKIDGWFR